MVQHLGRYLRSCNYNRYSPYDLESLGFQVQQPVMFQLHAVEEIMKTAVIKKKGIE